MAEIIGAKVVLDSGEAVKNVGTLRQQLKASLIDLQNMQEQFGDVSPEALKAAQSVAGLRDAIKDANEVAELFNPEKKFQAVVGVMQGIASGFAAAQGAMALFGVESEEVEKTLLKVQSAMALAQGLSGLKAATEDFKRLGAVLMNIGVVQKANALANAAAAATMRAFGVATTQTSVAFNVLKGAIVTTGIGVLVVALGYAVNALMDMAKSTDAAAEAQKTYNDILTEGANKVADLAVAEINRNEKVELARLKAAGATEAEITETQRQAILARQAAYAKSYNFLAKAGVESKELRKAAEDEVTNRVIFDYGVQQKAREESERKAKEAREKQAAEDEKARAKREAQDKKNAEALKTLGESSVEAAKEQGRREQEERDAKQKAIDEANNKFLDGEEKKLQDQLALEKEQADKRKEIDLAELDHKQQMVVAASGLLTTAAQLAGEQTVAGKVLAIAGATIATYASAQQAYWAAFSPVPTYLSPALGALYAAGAVATGLLNIKKIAAIQVPGKGGGGSNVPAISNTAPLTPARPATPTTRLDQDTINNIGNAVPVRAYVVESDITNSQERMVRIKNAAKFE